MDGVKKDIYSIMNALPGSNFSLIRFDNGAEIMTPFTQDINAVYDMVNDLSMPAYATARGSTLNTAHDALKAILESAGRKGRNRKTIVFIFSDGETTDGSDLMSFADLNGMIDDGAVLGYGTAEGGQMYYPGRGYVKNTTTGQNALSCIDEKSLLQAVDTAVEMNKAGDHGIPVPNYVDEIVSTKVVKIIQSYTGVVNKMVWRKF